MVNSDEFIRNSFRSLLSDGDPNGSEKKSAVGESVLLMATVLAIPLAALGGCFGSLLAQQAAATWLRAIRKASGPSRYSVPCLFYRFKCKVFHRLNHQPPLGDSRCCV